MKLSVITRAYNRLEYTVQCIASVIKSTGETDYEHIIVNQNSSDGTWQWLEWIKTHGGEPFSHVRPVHLGENVGDWGGMLAGYGVSRGQYVVQLDNDILVPPFWDWILMDAIEQTGHGASVLGVRGRGAEDVMPCEIAGTFKARLGDEYEYGVIRQVVTCYMVPRAHFQTFATLPNVHNCREFTRLVPDRPCRVFGVDCVEIDGSDEGDGKPKNRATYHQFQKYPRSNPQVWEKLA